MRFPLALAFGLLVPVFAGAQALPCDVHLRYRLNEGDARYAAFLARVASDDQTAHVIPRSPTVIPVVVHVVAPPDAAPVSEAQVLHQIDVLNADFAGAGENIAAVPELFRPLIADAGISFCLAQTDPAGQPTTGITYTSTDIPDIALRTGEEGRHIVHYDQLGGKTGWDPSRYLNIWVAEYGDFLGSASFPGMAPFEEEIGIVVHLDNFGSIGEAGANVFFGRGHTLTHEAGHFFGLKHTWGDGLDASCADTDDIADTPNAAGPYYGCPGGQPESCGSPDMYMNFMDFTDDRCLALFTPEQGMRMRTVLDAYYPELATDGPCRPDVADTDAWWDALVWSHDAASGKYIAYHPDWVTMTKEVEVFSMDGKLVGRASWGQASTHLLDLSRVASGVYVVRITAGSHRYVRQLVSY
jgi:hypothetical protein